MLNLRTHYQLGSPAQIQSIHLSNEENYIVKLTRISSISTLLILPFALTLATGSYAQDQHPILDKVAAKVIQKYQTSSCAQLKEQKAEKTPPTPQEQKAIQFLKSDPQMRTLFINKIAAPIANKMFDCGMIP
jgi:hypothetical protein